MRLATIIGLAIAVFAAVPGLLAATDGSSKPFTITISVPQQTIKVGEDILIHVVLTNISDHGISIPPATLNATCDYIIQIQGEKGLISGNPDCSGSHIMGIRQLNPGESVEGNISLGEITHYDSKLDQMVKTFDFSTPGEYVVQLSRHIADDPDKDIVVSNKLTITVTE